MLNFINLRRNLVTDRLNGFSKEPFNAFNLALHVGDDPILVKKNRRKLKKIFGMPAIAFMDQEHGDRVVLIDKIDRKNPPKCDAVITNKSSIALAVMSADCAPILFYDPINNAIGAAHAGWRGTYLQIAAKTAAAMKDNFGTNYENLRVAIAPCICAKCYEIGGEALEKYGELPNEYQAALSNNHLDLRLANALILKSIGVKEENMEISQECTFENKDFFSYRRDKITGRFASVISLKPTFQPIEIKYEA